MREGRFPREKDRPLARRALRIWPGEAMKAMALKNGAKPLIPVNPYPQCRRIMLAASFFISEISEENKGDRTEG
jgi:hypothetical protein